MACNRPLSAFQDADGKVHIGHERRGYPAVRTFNIPCGRCMGCRLKKSREYAIRCMHEAKCWPENSFITLTYDNAHLPPDRGLYHKHFQDFMKRLRDYYRRRDNRTIRYYMCGEYGENLGRPHYHAILFNVGFPDKLYFKTEGGFKLYTSSILNQLWTLGQNNLIGEVSLESAGYVARYCTQIITGDNAKDHYALYNQETGEIHHRPPEYAKMSLKPGIGATWLLKHIKDVYPADEVITNGRPSKPPRYYDKLLERVQQDDLLGYVQHKRYKRAQKGAKDNTDERLAVKEELQWARLAQRKRTL